MLKILLLLLAFAAIGLSVFYALIYQSPTPGATYQDSYALLSLGAAIIFSGLFYALIVNKERAEANMLLK